METVETGVREGTCVDYSQFDRVASFKDSRKNKSIQHSSFNTSTKTFKFRALRWQC